MVVQIKGQGEQRSIAAGMELYYLVLSIVVLSIMVRLL